MSSYPPPKPCVGPFRRDSTFGLPDPVATSVRAHAEAAVPREACGLVIRDDDGAWTVVACANVARDPRTSFRLGSLDQLRAARAHRHESLVALWHSHVDQPAELSTDDLRGLTLDGRPLYAGTRLLIVACHAGRAREIVTYSPIATSTSTA